MPDTQHEVSSLMPSITCARVIFMLINFSRVNKSFFLKVIASYVYILDYFLIDKFWWKVQMFSHFNILISHYHQFIERASGNITFQPWTKLMLTMTLAMGTDFLSIQAKIENSFRVKY